MNVECKELDHGMLSLALLAGSRRGGLASFASCPGFADDLQFAFRLLNERSPPSPSALLLQRSTMRPYKRQTTMTDDLLPSPSRAASTKMRRNHLQPKTMMKTTTPRLDHLL